MSWTAHDDLAEVAAALLAGIATHEGPTPPLTASEALTMGELAAFVPGPEGRPIQCGVLSDEAFRAKLTSRGLPPAVAELAFGFYLASRAGEFSAVGPTLRELPGRAPIAAKDAAANTIAAH